MLEPNFDDKKMTKETMLAKVEDVLRSGDVNDPPAYTLILGAGASSGVVPTAKEMLGLPDPRTKEIHEKSIPLWLAAKLKSKTSLVTSAERLACSRMFWKNFCANNPTSQIILNDKGLPESTSIPQAYQVLFGTNQVGGLDSPERQRAYMRDITLANGPPGTRLNATHFYLASLLSLQKGSNDLGSGGKYMYTGRREFARTIFTTNFDPLLQTSLQLFQLLYYMTDRPEALSADALQTDGHPAMHLFYAHGSVHRPYMANGANEIAHLKRQNARDLVPYFGSHGIIVLGYSGWDDCLLEALRQTPAFSNNLYWLVRNRDSISTKSADFLSKHTNAYWIEIEDGGNFMADLHARLCPGAPNTEMLFNPIRPLISQLKCVNLSGIKSAKIQPDNEEERGEESEAELDVETMRMQIVDQLEEAQKRFIGSLEFEDDFAELERRANLNYLNRDWSEALNNYLHLLNDSRLSKANQAIAHFRIGKCNVEQGDLKEAIVAFTAVIVMPGAPVEQVAKALFSRGAVLGMRGDFANAITDYGSIIKLEDAPIDIVTKALFNRAASLGQRGDHSSAIMDYTTLIKKVGVPVERVARARINRAYEFGRMGDSIKEMADYAAVITQVGSPIELVAMARLNRGISAAENGDNQQALDDFTEITKMNGLPASLIDNAMAKLKMLRSA